MLAYPCAHHLPSQITRGASRCTKPRSGSQLRRSAGRGRQPRLCRSAAQVCALHAHSMATAGFSLQRACDLDRVICCLHPYCTHMHIHRTSDSYTRTSLQHVPCVQAAHQASTAPLVTCTSMRPHCAPYSVSHRDAGNCTAATCIQWSLYPVGWSVGQGGLPPVSAQPQPTQPVFLVILLVIPSSRVARGSGPRKQ